MWEDNSIDRKVGKEYDQAVLQRRNTNGPITMCTSKNQRSANEPDTNFHPVDWHQLRLKKGEEIGTCIQHCWGYKLFRSFWRAMWLYDNIASITILSVCSFDPEILFPEILRHLHMNLCKGSSVIILFFNSENIWQQPNHYISDS